MAASAARCLSQVPTPININPNHMRGGPDLSQLSNEPAIGVDQLITNLAFLRRVRDAVRRLQEGESPQSIRYRHGQVVLAEAQWELSTN